MDVPESAEKEAVQTMIAVTKGLFRYLHGWVYTKSNPHLAKK